MTSEKIKKWAIGLIVPVIVLIAWNLETTFGSVPSGILPDISRVLHTGADMVKTGELQTDLAVSLLRVIKGFIFSAILGTVLGSLIGMFKPVKLLLLPTVTVIRQIPIIAWIPLIILWCGIGETSKAVIIVLAAFFPVLVNTESGIESTPQGFVEVARLYKLSKWKTFIKVYLPHALPQILVGLKLGLGVSWMAVVAAELIAATSGIGFRMSNARSMMRSDIVIVCMIVVGIIGVIMDKVIGNVFTLATPWNRKQS